jgi:hypothetical protein
MRTKNRTITTVNDKTPRDNRNLSKADDVLEDKIVKIFSYFLR